MEKPKRGRKPKDTVPAPQRTDGPVRVRCIVDTRPWHSTGFLMLDETADLPVADAEVMVAAGQVILIA